jgi:hypothetical protein
VAQEIHSKLPLQPAESKRVRDVPPLPTVLPKLPPQQTPYVYSKEELRRLLDATSILKGRGAFCVA